jgi:hypothetical protein
MSTRAEVIRSKIEDIQLKGDLSAHAARKRISAYRMFKKENAAKMKEEFPQMDKYERQMIVKD